MTGVVIAVLSGILSHDVSPPYLTPGPPSYELMDYNPVASDTAVVTAGSARFTVLTSRMIRMEYSSTKTFEDRPTLAILNRNLPTPSFTHEIANGILTITTTAIKLSYTLALKFDEQDVSGFSTPLIVTNVTPGAFTEWHYGKADPDNLLGTIKSLDQLGVEPLNCTENNSTRVHGESLHCAWGLVSRSGWAVVDDKPNWALTEGAEWWDSVNSDDQDLYILAHGHDYKGALKEFSMISGSVPMFPRYALGVWYTRWYDYNNLDVKEVVNRYREHNLPLDVYVTDMNWHKKDNWGGYSFDPNLYPYPQDTFGWLHSIGLHTAANLHDANGIGSYETMYGAMCKATGADCSQNKSIQFSIVNKTYVYALEDIVLGAVDEELDFYWIDWQQGGTQGGAAGGTQNPTIWTNKIRVTDPKRQGKSKRGLVLARWGGIGTHRYQVGFSGDVNPMSWDTLAYQPYFSLTASNVLYGYWSHDIEGPADDHEMYTRWVQWAAFSGVLRSHDRGMSGGSCAKSGGPLMGSSCSIVRIWETPDQFYEPMREALLLRAKMVPYIYNAVRASHTDGLGLVRPMYYEYPELDDAYNSTPAAAQYFFGEDLFVAPVTTPSNATTLLASTNIWVPPGTWYDLTFGQLIENSGDGSGSWLSRDWDLTEIPRFVRGGAVIPMIPVALGDTIGVAARQYTDLTFSIFPGAASGSCDVYEDDGNSRAYLTGAFATTTATFTSTETSLTFTVSSNGTYKEFPSSRPYTILLVLQPPPTEVKVNGVACTNCWTYDGPELTVSITTETLPTSTVCTIQVTFSSAATELSGLKGAFARANLAKKNLDMTRSTPGSHNTQGGILSRFSSVGDGLSYSASSARTDYDAAVSSAPTEYAAAVAEINSMKGVSTSDERLRALVDGPPPPVPSALNRVARAQALLASVKL